MVPMEPVLTGKVDASGDYLFQVKWDGVRILADRRSGDIRLYTRRGQDRTSKYAELASELEKLSAQDFLLDGEVIALNSDGIPDFHRILQRDRSKRSRPDIPVGYMVFDCLRSEGRNLCSEPLEKRQEFLMSLLTSSPLTFTMPCASFDNGLDLYRSMRNLGMEGIVAKRRGSAYFPGKKLPLWQKIKCWRNTVVKAVAVNYREGRPASVAAVRTVEGQFMEVGNVATGLKDCDWKRILELQASPCAGTSGVVPLTGPCFLRVRFLEWTPEGRLRAPIVISMLDEAPEIQG